MGLSSKSASASPSACLSLSFLSCEVELGLDLELPSQGCHMDKTNGACPSQLKTGTREVLSLWEPLSFTDTDPQGCMRGVLKAVRIYIVIYGAGVESSEMGLAIMLPQGCWGRALGLL